MRGTTEVIPVASAPSSLDFGVEPFQFHAGVFDTKLPIDTALFAVCLVRPGCNFSLQYGQCTDAAVAETLAREATQFTFGNIEPATVFWGVTEVDAFDVRSRAVRCKRFIERACGVRGEVVAHEGHIRAIRIARLQHLRNFDRPVGFRPPCARGRLPETR